MSPRILDVRHCPHCEAELPQPVPRVCPACAGSIQKRYLSTGCLTSKPLIALLGLGLASAAGATAALVRWLA